MIRITCPALGEEELKAIAEVLDSGFLTQGAKVQAFEKALSNFTGASHVVAVSSGTAALHLALLAMGIGSGDEVITSAFTFPATVNTIELTGAKSVLIDIELTTFNIDVSRLESSITSRTKAILPVHEFGLMADMNAIGQFSRSLDLAVIEDAACALGASQRIGGNKVFAGAAGDIGCFSFHPRKSITTAEGGCLTTSKDGIADRLRILRNHGMVYIDGECDFILPGFNYRLTEIQGAMGSIQLEKFGWILSERNRQAKLYNELLSEVGWLQRPSAPEGWTHSYQSYVVLLDKDIDRHKMITSLKTYGVEAVRGAYAVHRLSYYRERYGYSVDAFPFASRAHDCALALPLYPGMPDEAVSKVVDCLIKSGS